MPQSFTCLHCHLTFSTKQRLPLITPEIESRLHQYLSGILRANNGSLLAAGGMPDHVHLLARLDKAMSVSDGMRLLKANSSKWVHETFSALQTFAWQGGYAAFSVSLSSLPAVKKYLAGQAEHHRKMTFQEELRQLLRRHHIELNERYGWD
jgi:REP element-mobilizing transposase RayT